MHSSDDVSVVAGAGTHRDTHTAAVCGRAGQALAVREFRAGPEGYAAALARAVREAGGAGLAWAIEGTRHYGPGLARYLTAAGQRVEETGSGRHAGRRRSGNSDATGAAGAGREMLARPGPAPMRADGDREARRLLTCDRDNAVDSAKTARTLLTSLIVTAPAAMREQLRHIARDRRATVCASLAAPPGADRQTCVPCQTLARIGQRITALARTAADLEKQITALLAIRRQGRQASCYGSGSATDLSSPMRTSARYICCMDGGGGKGLRPGAANA